MTDAWAVVVAAGKGARFGGEGNKVYRLLAGQSILSRTLASVEASGEFSGIVVVYAPGEEALARAAARDCALPVLYAPGGERRMDSVGRALDALPEEAAIVAIQDGARPLTAPDVFTRCVAAARAYGSGVAASEAVDTIKRVNAQGIVVETPDRSLLRAVKTPQCFRTRDVKAGYRRALEERWEATDDAQVMERCGVAVHLVPCGADNIKVTAPQDIRVAEALLGLPLLPRVGVGYDVHALEAGRPLILCGVLVPHERGLMGHSDADVATHALIDALLGACALGDIGMLFPDTDERFRGADSIELLADALQRVREAGYRPASVDVTILAQRPRLSAYREDMRARLAAALALPAAFVSVKMTTTERLGFVGREEGIAAQAAATVVAWASCV